MVTAGCLHTVGLRTDGTLIAPRGDGSGECTVERWRDVIAVSAGSYHTVALEANGTVRAAGDNWYGQCEVRAWPGHHRDRGWL
jgi:alpha-tubulin suppressor-like RCC1 family protein